MIPSHHTSDFSQPITLAISALQVRMSLLTQSKIGFVNQNRLKVTLCPNDESVMFTPCIKLYLCRVVLWCDIYKRERETEQGYYKEPSIPHNTTDIYVSVDALFIQVPFFFLKRLLRDVLGYPTGRYDESTVADPISPYCIFN